MAKSYYQSWNGGFKLDRYTFGKLINEARRYGFLQNKIEEIENKSELDITENDLINKVALEERLAVLEGAIEKYVEEPCREAVKAHAWWGVEYGDLYEKYYLSISTMKRAFQKYIWGLAQEYGEDFNDKEKMRKGRMKRGRRL